MKAWLLAAILLNLSTVTFAEEPRELPGTCLSGICDLCFSPKEACDQKLIAYINTTKTSLDIAIYSITLPDIASAIIKAKQRGVNVRLIADYKSSFMKSSMTNEIKQAGVPVRLWSGENNLGGLMHHKFAIADSHMVQTGSYNYSRNATKRNAENQIYTVDPVSIRKFTNEFERLWNQLQ